MFHVRDTEAFLIAFHAISIWLAISKDIAEIRERPYEETLGFQIVQILICDSALLFDFEIVNHIVSPRYDLVAY